MKSIKTLFAALFALVITASAVHAAEPVTLVIGVTPFPHHEIVNVAAAQLAGEGINLDVREFNDYVTPNLALADGSLDANFYQHIPYLDNMVAEQKLEIGWIARVHIEPMGLYSKKIKSLDEIEKGASIAVPNDPTNGARALRLLEKHGLIKLKEGALVTALDITENPKELKIVELEAAQLPRTLDDTTASVINTNFAAEADLNPSRDAIVIEDKDSPYSNVLVVRNADMERPEIKALAAALNSPEVKKFIEDELIPRGIVPAF